MKISKIEDLFKIHIFTEAFYSLLPIFTNFKVSTIIHNQITLKKEKICQQHQIKHRKIHRKTTHSQ